MARPPTHRELDAKELDIGDGFPDAVRLRVHRAISWLGRAERAKDADVRFILLWIAFNAAYADEDKLEMERSNGNNGSARGDRWVFAVFFETLTSLDRDRHIYDSIWTNFSGSIRLLMDNKYVYGPFWKHQNGVARHGDWESRFERSKQRFQKAIARQNTVVVLTMLFDRLYMLRNQMLHGGATWNSSVNRSQVNDGAAILGFLVPTFIDLMMDHPDQEWGRPFYPVVN